MSSSIPPYDTPEYHALRDELLKEIDGDIDNAIDLILYWREKALDLVGAARTTVEAWDDYADNLSPPTAEETEEINHRGWEDYRCEGD